MSRSNIPKCRCMERKSRVRGGTGYHLFVSTKSFRVLLLLKAGDESEGVFGTCLGRGEEMSGSKSI